ncbi:MAG TPA: hypothetical protein H9903_10490 [Candidatus Aquabacterium excrementipullorum]|nr:hypothetical protein [Candidatus Aquabacterium excrementipullorum]
MFTSDLIILAKKRAGIESDYALAKCLETKPNTVGNWSRGVSFPDTKFTVQLAEMAGFEPMHAIAQVEIERAEKTHSDKAVSFWRRYAGAGASTAAAVLVGAFLSVPSAPAHSAVSPSVDGNVHCKK